VYSDNSAVMAGYEGKRFYAAADGKYVSSSEHRAILMKVETHNHPTAIAPNPGAATGSGGEIRDEGATGQGSKPKVGLCGFSVSNLKIDGAQQPWEVEYGKPSQIVSALDIMLEGPIGAAPGWGEIAVGCLWVSTLIKFAFFSLELTYFPFAAAKNLFPS
jgi:phosphoribosylformylglycinamidine synthase